MIVVVNLEFELQLADHGFKFVAALRRSADEEVHDGGLHHLVVSHVCHGLPLGQRRPSSDASYRMRLPLYQLR